MVVLVELVLDVVVAAVVVVVVVVVVLLVELVVDVVVVVVVVVAVAVVAVVVLSEHVNPVHAPAHTHLKEAALLTHVAPFMQTSESHSSMSTSQFLPMYPVSAQLHE